jgi:hypothetical protein
MLLGSLTICISSLRTNAPNRLQLNRRFLFVMAAPPSTRPPNTQKSTADERRLTQIKD